MAYASWPGSLPQYVLEQGFNESLPDAVIETAMEAGRPKARRRYTTAGETYAASIACDATQRSAFNTFYLVTLQNGTLPFTWVHPVTRVATNFRFRKPAPRWSVRAGAVHLASFALERIP